MAQATAPLLDSTLSGHLKINRAIAYRYNKPAESFLGMLYLAAAKCSLQRAYSV